MLGYFPGLIHSWYIIAKYPPYWEQQHQTTRVYVVYKGDLENQLPNREVRYHHCHQTHESPQPQYPPANAGILADSGNSYGAVVEGTSSAHTEQQQHEQQQHRQQSYPSSNPPAYSEFDNKAQR